MLSLNNIFDTIDMIDKQHLDIRTITMGISLLDCVSEDPERCCRKIYDKICRRAERLVKTGEDIESEFGIPIVNKRISVTPIALVAGSCATTDYVPFALTLDRAAKTCGVNFIGGYSALVHKGFAKGDELLLRSIPQAMAQTELVCSSVNVGSTRAGINMDAVAAMGRIIKQTAHLTRDTDGLGCAKLVVFCNAVEDNPFMAGAFHGVGEADSVINVGVSGPGVVYHALQKCKGAPFDVVAETIKKTAFQITRMGQMVAAEASDRLNVPFGIVDLSLAPTPAVGDSVARILEEMGLETCGTHGTTAALALLNDAVKKVLKDQHLALVNWSVDTRDWQSRNTEKVLETAFQSGNYGIRDGAIVLMHDVYETTLNAAVRMMDRLIADGYTIVTVPELLAARNEVVYAGVQYHAGF